MEHLRDDLNCLISVGLLVMVTITALTGVIADLWDLNDFWYHTYSGYVMATFALAHVCLNWGRLSGYARFRFGRQETRGQALAASTSSSPAARHQRVLRTARRAVVSRRGFLALIVGGAGGFFLGQALRPPPIPKAIPKGSDLGLIYHEWSEPGPMDVFGAVSNWGQRPPLYKSYERARKTVLPKALLDGGLSAEAAITSRRSTREYSGKPMTLAELSHVLFMMDGVSHGWDHQLRTAPSAGALYPIEAYPVVHHVTGLEPGLYHYGVRDHLLDQLHTGDMRDEVVRQGLSQGFLGKCNVVVFLTIIFQRMRFKYQDRTYRYALIEAGHLGQNIYLAATSMGLGACAVGAFMDDAVNEMLGVDGKEEAAVYMLSVGKV